MSKNNMNWNSKLLPVPYTRTLTFPEVTLRSFCSLRFNQNIESTLIKANLSTSKDAYFFELLPQQSVQLKASHTDAYVITSGCSEFISQDTQTFDVRRGHVAALETEEASYRIRISGASSILVNVIDSQGDTLVQMHDDSDLDIEYTGSWLAFENLEARDVTIEVIKQ